MNFIRHVSAITAFSLCFEPSFAQRLVDPTTVAPEFRDAAEKRRAEQLKLIECAKKAKELKVLIRDRAAFISECIQSENQPATVVQGAK
jgi:hypothetical protein